MIEADWPMQSHRELDEHEFLTELSPSDVRKLRIEEDLEEIAELKAQEYQLEIGEVGDVPSAH